MGRTGFALFAGLAVLVEGQSQTCTPAADVEVTIPAYEPKEPAVTGMMPGTTKPKIILAQDIDWPPYAYLAEPPEGDLTTGGIGRDIAMGMASMCNLDVTVIEAKWSECWSGGRTGEELKMGIYSGCTVYTHTHGQRARQLEFTHPILDDKIPAGILTRLVNGAPVINGKHNLNGVKIMDVTGWAPTADTLPIATNPCTGQKFAGFVMHASATVNPNDDALAKLLDGTVDALWIMANQAKMYQCDGNGNGPTGTTATWNCANWNKFGSEFAYVQTGLGEHALNGTTLGISKKGTGLSHVLNPCIEKFIKTKEYYDICVKHNMVSSCFKNAHFPNANAAHESWEKKANLLTSACNTGYCKCPP